MKPTSLHRAAFAGSAILAATFAFAADLPFADDFDDNRHGWPNLEESDARFTEFADGVLVFENLALEGGAAQFSALPFALDKSRDWIVEARMRFVSGVDNYGYSLELGRNDAGWKCAFLLSGNQNYSWGIFNGSGWETAGLPWKFDPELVKRDTHNTIVVRKIGSKLYFQLNDQILDTAIVDLKGDQIGFAVPSGATIEIDRLSVAYADGTTAQRTALADQLEEQLRNFRIKSGPPLENFVETFDDNNANWPWMSEGETWSGKIEGGSMVWANRAESAQSIRLNKPVNAKADYELSLRFTHLAGPKDNSIGLKFGCSEDSAKEHLFALAPDGHYIFQTWNAGVSSLPIPWTKIDLLKPDANEIAIQKAHDRVFLFINGQLIADLPAPEHFGPMNGVSVSPGMTVAFDEFAIRYFPRTLVQSIAAKMELDEQLLAVYQKGKVKGALHQLAAARARDEENERNRELEMLNDADYKQLKKVRKQFSNKNILNLYASWKRPVAVMGDPDNAHRIYYNYKLKGRKQYYYEFQVFYTGPGPGPNGEPVAREKKWFAITNIVLTDSMW